VVVGVQFQGTFKTLVIKTMPQTGPNMISESAPSKGAFAPGDAKFSAVLASALEVSSAPQRDAGAGRAKGPTVEKRQANDPRAAARANPDPQQPGYGVTNPTPARPTPAKLHSGSEGGEATQSQTETADAAAANAKQQSDAAQLLTGQNSLLAVVSAKSATSSAPTTIAPSSCSTSGTTAPAQVSAEDGEVARVNGQKAGDDDVSQDAPDQCVSETGDEKDAKAAEAAIGAETNKPASVAVAADNLADSVQAGNLAKTHPAHKPGSPEVAMASLQNVGSKGEPQPSLRASQASLSSASLQTSTSAPLEDQSASAAALPKLAGAASGQANPTGRAGSTVNVSKTNDDSNATAETNGSDGKDDSSPATVGQDNYSTVGQDNGPAAATSDVAKTAAIEALQITTVSESTHSSGGGQSEAGRDPGAGGESVAQKLSTAVMRLEDPPETSASMATPLLQAATLVERAGMSELRVGIRSEDFGNIDIRTSLSQNQLSAQISVEHLDLGHALSAEVSNLQTRLSERDLPPANITFQNQAGGTNSGSDQRSQQGERRPFAPSSGGREIYSHQANVHLQDSAEMITGLDIHM
jgi:hypothetical protein